MNAIGFTLKGRYGHHIRLDGAMVKQTHTIPTKTALYGLLGAILGRERDSYYEEFSDLSIAIVPLHIRRESIAQNHLSTESLPELGNTGIKAPDHTKKSQRVPVEYLVNPEYKIYIDSENESLLSEIKETLSSKSYEYTPCLGTTECLADLSLDQSITVTEIDSSNVDSVVPDAEFDKIIPSEKAEITFEKIASNFKSLDKGRKPTGFQDVIVPLNQKSLILKDNAKVYTDGEFNFVYI